ncbi:hypothetical protein RB195_019196 [Necator americanus]|uniref:Uncharacterized protein n=1 Tax=Necator americanus TaxID=51031 RepID=A0ABR1CD16_NECAM
MTRGADGSESYEVYKSEFVHFDDVRGTTLLKKNLSLRAMESYGPFHHLRHLQLTIFVSVDIRDDCFPPFTF